MTFFVATGGGNNDNVVDNDDGVSNNVGNNNVGVSNNEVRQLGIRSEVLIENFITNA